MLCDLEIWSGAPNDLLRSLLEHLLELSSESSEKRSNIRIMRDLQLVTKLLHIIPDIREPNTSEIVYSLLSVLLGSQPKHLDLLFFGQYIASKIPLVGQILLYIVALNFIFFLYSHLSLLFSQSTASNEKQLKFSPEQKDIDAAIKEVTDQQQKDAIKNILLRNRALRLLHALLFTARNTVNNHLSDDISRILGLDWLLLLMQPQIHSSTVILGIADRLFSHSFKFTSI